MRWNVLIFSAIILLIISNSVFCSQLPPRELGELLDSSNYVFIGTVSNVELIEDLGKNGKKFEIDLKVTGTIKGIISEEIIKIRTYIGGIRGFSIPLKVNQKGVFFMRTIENGSGELTHWGSIALFNESYFK